MAAEKRRVMGLLAAWHLASVVAFLPFVNKTDLDANEINPFRGAEPEDEGVARAKRFIASRRWRAVAKAATERA